MAWDPNGRTLARLVNNGTVALDHAWDESDVCANLRTLISDDEMDALVGIPTAVSACAHNVDLIELPPIPASPAPPPS